VQVSRPVKRKPARLSPSRTARHWRPCAQKRPRF
jgi:hypothetical protein